MTSRCVLVGGGDIDPGLYGQETRPEVAHVNPARDEFEIPLVRAAIATGLPTLCICRGAQVLNVALGGTLVQDVPTHQEHRMPTPGPMHPVLLEPGSRLEAIYGSRQMDVNSAHHQAISALGDGLAVTARAADGTVEAIELRDGALWVLAVQWHPEAMQAVDAPQRKLFAALVEQARRQRAIQPPSTTSVEPVT